MCQNVRNCPVMFYCHLKEMPNWPYILTHHIYNSHAIHPPPLVQSHISPKQHFPLDISPHYRYFSLTIGQVGERTNWIDTSVVFPIISGKYIQSIHI